MLGLVGVIAAESSTGISWADAGKVMAEQPSYLGFDINIPLTTIVWIEVLAMGFVEVKRSAGASPEPHPNPRIVGFFLAGHLSARQIPVGFRAIRLPPQPPVHALISLTSPPPRARLPPPLARQSLTLTSAATPAATSTPSATPTATPRRSSSSRRPSSSTAASRWSACSASPPRRRRTGSARSTPSAPSATKAKNTAHLTIAAMRTSIARAC